MNRADVIRLARDSKMLPAVIGSTRGDHFKYVERFVALVEAEVRKEIEAAVLAEREACALTCTDIAQEAFDPTFAHDCAEAIRARSKHDAYQK